MNHQTAISTRAAERYVLGELSDQDRDDFEAHYFSCHECADDITALAALVEGLPEALGSRDQRAEPREQTQPTTRSTLLRGRWTAALSLTRLAAAAAAILLVGVAAYQSLVVVPTLRAELAALEAPRSSSWHFLSVTRSAVGRVDVPAGLHTIGLTLSRSEPHTFPFYRVELVDAEERPVQSAIVLGPPSGDEIQLMLPVARLAPGSYTLVLAGLESATAAAASSRTTRYPFVLEFVANERSPQ